MRQGSYTNKSIGANNQLQSPATPLIYTASTIIIIHYIQLLSFNDRNLWTQFPDSNSTPLSGSLFTTAQHL